MRVVAGLWRGRRLQAPKGLATRPTADRVREALFSILGTAVPGALVADLCCGSGALGIEALSRGALRADFVDHDPRALRAVRDNLKDLEVPKGQWLVHRAEAQRWLREQLLRVEEPPLLILADPPYDDPAAEDIVTAARRKSQRVKLLVLEHAAGAGPEVPEGWRLDRRSYGRTELSILEPTP